MLYKANLLTCSSHVPWLSSRAQNFCKLCQEGPLPASFHPRATQGQITSYCETRRVLLLPANTCRSGYIIFIIIVLLDPEDKGLITFQTLLANGQVCWIKGATTVWNDDRMRIVPWLWERLVESLKICAGMAADIGREELASSQSPQTAHQTAL